MSWENCGQKCKQNKTCVKTVKKILHLVYHNKLLRCTVSLYYLHI